jgi:hypothetical protein
MRKTENGIQNFLLEHYYIIIKYVKNSTITFVAAEQCNRTFTEVESRGQNAPFGPVSQYCARFIIGWAAGPSASAETHLEYS